MCQIGLSELRGEVHSRDLRRFGMCQLLCARGMPIALKDVIRTSNTETFAISKDLEIYTRIEAKSGGESRNATLGSILHNSMGEWPDLEMQSALDSEVGH